MAIRKPLQGGTVKTVPYGGAEDLDLLQEQASPLHSGCRGRRPLQKTSAGSVIPTERSEWSVSQFGSSGTPTPTKGIM